jgi:hypothetical protein
LFKKKFIIKAIVSFCLILIVFLNASQTTIAREAISVTIVPPAKTTIAIGDEILINAQASGGPGLYNYGFQWYINDTAIEYATWTPYRFTPNQTGTYNFKCDAWDTSGETTESATSSTVTLTVTAKPQAASQSPNTSDLPRAANPNDNGKLDSTGIDNQWIQITAIFAIVAFAVVVTLLVIKNRGSKKTK